MNRKPDRQTGGLAQGQHLKNSRFVDCWPKSPRLTKAHLVDDQCAEKGESRIGLA